MKVCPHRLAESIVMVAFTARIVFLLCEPGVVLPCIENSPALLICAALAVSLNQALICLLYTSDAADDLTRVELGGGRIIQKKKNTRVDGSSPSRLISTKTPIVRGFLL